MAGRHTQILSGSSYNRFKTLQSVSSSAGFNPTPYSASLGQIIVIQTMSGSYNSRTEKSALELSMINGTCNEKEAAEVHALLDVRLNPQLLAKHIWNSALLAGSSSNAAYELAYPKA
jgi:hypothetical protein